MVMRLPFSAAILAIPLLAGAVLAQNDDIYVYPAKGQSQAQQDKDRYECHSWAVQQTGFDPSKPQTAMPTSGWQDNTNRRNLTLPEVPVVVRRSEPWVGLSPGIPVKVPLQAQPWAVLQGIPSPR